MFRKVLWGLSPWVPRWLKDLFPERIKQLMRRQYLPRTVLIDIVGSCNLACPSCPSGGPDKNRGGKMSLEMFRRILEKISKEQPGATVSIFNWTEPLIHPQAAEFVEAIRHYGLKSRVSTNLNLLKDADRFAAASPDFMTISLSGFTQPVYSIGHEDGDIEVVKENMRKLSDAFKKANASTELTVYYHKYLHNLHEVDLMKQYAESLGFAFGSGWAYYMPIERVQAYMEDRLPPEEVEFVENRFALNIRRAVEATKPFRDEPCLFPTTQLTIDCRGNVQLCCAVYDAKRFTIGSYLDSPWAEIESKLLNHSYCRECGRHGLHIYTSWHGHKKIHPIYEAIAEEECRRHSANPGDQPAQEPARARAH